MKKTKSEYDVSDVVGPDVKIDKDKDYCCTMKDYIAVMKRRVQDDMEFIQLMEKYGGDIYIPVSLILSELHKYSAGRLLSPAHRFYNFVNTAADSIAYHSTYQQGLLEVVNVSNHCKSLLQKIKCTSEDDDAIFIQRVLQRAADIAAQYINKERSNTKQVE